MAYRHDPKHKLIPVDVYLISSYKNAALNNDFPVAKWIQFCEILISDGFTVHYYHNKKTVSKYVQVSKANHKPYLVRFSNHAPIPRLEAQGTCDFFVGVTNFQVTTTKDALREVYKHFNVKPRTKLYFDFMNNV